MPPKTEACRHEVLQLEPSPFAPLAGYAQPTTQKRAAATTTSGRASKGAFIEPNDTFPAPLALPHDDLNYDAECSPQSVKEWLHMKSRNDMSPDRGRDTLYIGRVPSIGKKWTSCTNGPFPSSDLAWKIKVNHVPQAQAPISS